MATVVVTRSGLSADDDLPAAWSKIISALEVQANYKLDPDTAPSIAQITADIKPAKVDPTTTSKIKGIFAKALVCIDRFGGIIATASSVVFPASNQVYNAVSFLIHVSQDSQAVFDNLTALMERLSAFLDRLNLYLDQKAEEKLDKNLRWSVYQVLEQFVTIMALSYKLTGTWKSSDGTMKSKLESFNRKAKNFIKIGAFGDDSGVKTAIATFERLVSRVTNVQIDEIHRTLSSAARAICDIGEELHAVNSTVQLTNVTVQSMNTTVQESTGMLQQMLGDEDKKKTEKFIMNVLQLDDKDVNICRRAHDEYQDQTTATGNWLFARSDFRQWSDLRNSLDSRRSILTIQGPEGYGKSYLAHATINHLLDESKDDKLPSHTHVAWYYCQRESKKTSFNQVIRQIILQLAKLDGPYMQYVKAAITAYTPSDCENTSKLWSQLISDYSKRQPATILFIVVDGIDRLSSEGETAIRDVLERVMSAKDDPEGLRIRLLLLGEDTISKIPHTISHALTPIDLCPSKKASSDSLEQQDDIVKFVTRKLDAIKIFASPLSRDRQVLKDRIIDELPTGARGNYNVLKQKLQEIADSVDATQVEDVLRRVPEDQSTAIGREIESLNDRLSGQHIKQLNEIFAWVATAITYPSGDVLRSTLSINFQEYALYDPIEYLRTNCSRLFEIDDSTAVRFTSSEVETSLRNAQPTRPTVPEAEIDVIQTMVQTNFKNVFGDHKIYDRFGFAKFFQDKRNVQTELIHLPPEKINHLAILETCLKVVCDLYDVEKYQPLRDYASDYFDEHLTNVDLTGTDPAQKQQLGRRLYRMLHEDAVIDIWARDELMWGMTDWFDDENDFCAALFDWMKDPVIQQSIQAITTETKWIVEVTTEEAPKQKLLQHIARRILRRWYEDDEVQDTAMPFTWLRGYFLKASKWAKEYETVNYWHDITVRELERWEDWARDELQLTLETAQWHYRMAGVYNRAGARDEWKNDAWLQGACGRCDRAAQLDPGTWKAQVYKGVVLLRCDRSQACIDHLETMANDNAELLSSGKDAEYQKVYWGTVAPTIADSYLKLKRFDIATHWYRRTLDHSLENELFSNEYDTYVCGLIDALHQQGSFGDALELLKTLDDRVSIDRSWLQHLLQTPYSNIHQHIIRLTLQTEAFHDMDAYYDRAIQRNDGMIASITPLEYVRGKLHWYCGPEDHRESVIVKWETIMETTNAGDGQWDYFVRIEGTKELAKSLHYLATRANLDPLKLEDYIKRIKKLCDGTDDLRRYSLARDARLVHARVLHLTGNHTQARDLLQSEIRKALKRVREEDDARDGYKMLAMILPALDDDAHALAAWSLMEPDREEAVASSTDGDHAQKGPEPPKPSASGQSTDTQPPSNGQPADDIVICADAHEPVGAARSRDDSGTGSGTGSDCEDPPASELKGCLGLVCDGDCGRSWSYADDMYICRDCLCVQLDPACYAKLQAGKLDVTVCSAQHSHLYIPAFDEAAWRASDPTKVLVNAELRTREQWLKDLEAEWGLDGTGEEES